MEVIKKRFHSGPFHIWRLPRPKYGQKLKIRKGAAIFRPEPIVQYSRGAFIQLIIFGICSKELSFLALLQNLRNPDNRLGRFGTPCIIQLFLGTPLIYIHEKLHSWPQNSKTRAGAGLEDINMDQSETRSDMPGLWLVHIYIIMSSSGPGLWVLWWTMQLFINVYQISTQK